MPQNSLTKRNQETKPTKHSVNQFEADESEEEINAITQKHSSKILATMKIGEKEVEMLVDSGASCNVLPIRYLPKGTMIEKSSHTLKMYSKSAIGKAKVPLVNPENAERYLIDFTIVDGNFTPLLGLKTAHTQKILSLEDMPSQDVEKPQFTKEAVLSEHSDVFREELGCMQGKIHLETEPNVAPTVMPPRRIPIALKEKLKNELDRPTKRKAISSVQEPTDWVSCMIAAQKPDRNIRLCIDPHYLKGATIPSQ